MSAVVDANGNNLTGSEAAFTQRLAYYTSELPLAEITTTYRFPPTPEVSRQWVQRTPPGFVFDVRCWSLLTEAPTLPATPAPPR